MAYVWENLFFSCQICNQRFKKNLFPLADPAARAISHHDNIANESPILVNPANDIPEDHISFRDEIAYPVHENGRGEITIDAFGLNRDELIERRAARLKILRYMKLVVATASDAELVTQAQEWLRNAVLDGAQFCAMARVALAGD